MIFGKIGVIHLIRQSQEKNQKDSVNQSGKLPKMLKSKTVKAAIL
jgi:hypothetical protein